MCDTLLYPHTCGRYFLFEKSLSKNTNLPHCPTLYPNSLPPLKPPPPFFFSAKPGSMHRKQLSLTSACLLVARCILGMERCVTVDMWLTLYKVPLL